MATEQEHQLFYCVKCDIPFSKFDKGNFGKTIYQYHEELGHEIILESNREKKLGELVDQVMPQFSLSQAVKQAKEILQTDPEQLKIYKNEDFAIVANEIQKKHNFITLRENDEVFIFNGKIYEPYGDKTIREESHSMIQNCKKGTTIEIIDWIRRNKTYRSMKEVYNNYIINTESGIIDPSTLELLPHGPQYYTLSTLPFKVDPSARNYKLWKHILTIIDHKDVGLVLELLWILISWRNPYKKMFVFKGPSNSQKTTLVNIIEMIIGSENLSKEKPEKFLGRESRFATYHFIGKRGNIASELGNLTEEHIENQKALVGAEKQTTEKKHDNAEYVFDPEHFVFLYSTNNLNAIYQRMEDNSIITRFQFLIFRNIIADQKLDGDWLAKFFEDDQDKETAISTIINLVLGFKKYQKKGLIPKTRFSTVAETKKILTNTKDPEDRYFDENRLIHKVGSKLLLADVRTDFEKYVNYKTTNQAIGYILKKNGFDTKQSNSKTWIIDTDFADPKQEVLSFDK